MCLIQVCTTIFPIGFLVSTWCCVSYWRARSKPVCSNWDALRQSFPDKWYMKHPNSLFCTHPSLHFSSSHHPKNSNSGVVVVTTITALAAIDQRSINITFASYIWAMFSDTCTSLGYGSPSPSPSLSHLPLLTSVPPLVPSYLSMLLDTYVLLMVEIFVYYSTFYRSVWQFWHRVLLYCYKTWEYSRNIDCRIYCKLPASHPTKC